METLELYTTKDMSDDLEAGASGLDSSIKKWKIALKIGERLQVHICTTCGLCKEYPIGCRSSGNDASCPLAKDKVNKENKTHCTDDYWRASKAISNLINAASSMIARLEKAEEEQFMEPKEPEFQPVTLLLETKEEADLLWHYLNNTESQTFNDYIESRPPLAKAVGETLHRLWQRVDREVYHPKE